MSECILINIWLLILLLLLACLIGFLIGYILLKKKKIPCPKCPELEKEIADLKLQIAKSREDTKVGLFSFDATKAKEILGTKVIENDLKIVEGIGPKISEILIKRGITTWKALSESDPAVIKSYLLNDGGELYRIHVPDTWPYQAKLAYEGKWEELKALQENLIGGRKA